MTLTQRLQEINGKAAAWVAGDPEHRLAGMLTTELAHWASINVTTADELDHYLAVCEYVESHKEAYGFKPDWSAANAMSDDRLKRLTEEHCAEIMNEIEAEEADERAHENAIAKAMNHASGWNLGQIVGLL